MIFNHIRQLGKTGYSEYRESISADFTRFPWKYQVQRRAKRITEKAKLCIESRKNESGWRLSLESEVMARFSVEIACRNCRGRLWRSEQEVVATTQPGEDDANSLKSRQRRRQPCNCNPNGLSRDIPEQGISPLFDDRAEEAIIYSSELRAELPKREDRPDRVYGLQVTERLSRLLDLAEGIRSSPFRIDGDPLVFPFLVIEAKSEKGSDAFTDIQVQTGFAIRELLSIQHQLAQAAEEDTEWDGGPLVWFLSYKGEEWRVFAAYMHNNNVKTSYRVVRLWSGSVDSLDSALQLLLIIDYIADWARDIYREGIARSLYKLTESDSASLARDADIFSLAGNVREWACHSPDASEVETSQPLHDPLHELDCESGVFRDARFIHNKFVSLIITENNVDEFLGTVDSDVGTRKLAASLLASIQDSIRVKGYMLDELELLWTDTERHLSNMAHPDEVFYVVVSSVFYLNMNWEQVRELSYVAVAASLIQDLAKIAQIPLPSVKLTDRAPVVESLTAFGSLLERTAIQNLASCVTRLCLATGSGYLGKSVRVQRWEVLPTVTEASKALPRDAFINICQRPRAREFLYSIYSKHQVGRNVPASSIFRISSTMDIMRKSGDPPELNKSSLDPDWPASLYHMNQKLLYVWIDTDHPGVGPELCIFILDTSAIKDGIEIEFLTAPPVSSLRTNLYTKQTQKMWNIDSLDSGKVASSKVSDYLMMLLKKFNLELLEYVSYAGSLTRKWNIITAGFGVASEADDESEFTHDRPFKRRAHQNSLKASLLGHKAKRAMFSPQKLIVIGDDDKGPMEGLVTAKELNRRISEPHPPGSITPQVRDNDIQIENAHIKDEPPSPSEGRGQKRPLEAVHQNDEAESSAHAARRAMHQQANDTRDNESQVDPSVMVESKKRKRPMRVVDAADEAESSAHAERRARQQREVDQRFNRDSLADEELAEILEKGKLP
ncbi:hypothetical protein FBEOM_10490 [Fusarium beomiforme]|uniref:Uncharacterized protein n=1 Tax=Fusarium beomiforme TaxID=44412 RepID=A0A9P5DVA0_9HYPO|nr:hypothetical protein FBEOM_10490 [Fusarium beomiforme]